MNQCQCRQHQTVSAAGCMQHGLATMYTMDWMLILDTLHHFFLEPVAAPENVQVEASEDKPSIFVTWSPIQKQYYNSDSLTGYHVRYTTSSKDCRGEEIEVGPDETSCSLDFLDRGVAYAVSVAAANDVGMGPYSSPSSVTSKASYQ